MLAFLGDNFVLPRPVPLANVFSIGDVLIGVGGALFVFQAMHGRVLPRLTSPGGASRPMVEAKRDAPGGRAR